MLAMTPGRAVIHLISLILTLICAAVPAGAVEFAEDAPTRYSVQPGDTLWSIAGRFLRDPWRWSEVWDANPDVADPDRIYPGDVLEVRYVDGQPRIGVVDGGGEGGGMRVVRLTPQTHSSALNEAVPLIRISKIAPFLSRPYVADSDAIKRAAYVVGFPDEHIVAGVDDDIYVRRMPPTSTSELLVLRPGDELRDPDTNEILGYEANYVGTARLVRAGDPSKLRMVSVEREVSIGDRVIPNTRERPLQNFVPTPAPPGSRGRIVSVLNGVSQVGPMDVVIINRGSANGLAPGHVLEIFVGGTKARDQVASGQFASRWEGESPLSSEFWLGRSMEFKGWRRGEPAANEPLPIHADYRRNRGEYARPYERSGVLMVFRTFERVSFGLVLEAGRFINVGDWVDPPPS